MASLLILQPTALRAASAGDRVCNVPACKAHAWCPSRRPVQRRRQHGSISCQAKSDVGRLLRDALQQPAQGQNLAYLAAGNWLRGLGIDNQADINRVLDVAMNPNSLYVTRNRKQPTNPHARKLEVEADLAPVADFLLAAGLTKEQLARAIMAHPPLLCYSVPDRLQPFFAYLTGELGLSTAEAVGVVERRPTLLGVEVGSLRRMVGFLQESGTSREAIIEMMATTL